MLLPLLFLNGKPESSGQIRSTMADFKVFEELPFSPVGEGEHLLIHLEKSGQNTLFVAQQLAKYFGIKEALVSYAGLKDRFAITQQWFGVHLPGKTQYDLSDLAIEGVTVLSYARHNKKLKVGALKANRFELILRHVTEIEALKMRWQRIVSYGVPNYFGEQRFGIDGGNIDKALALFAGGKVKDKKKRGIYLSAARSYLFNQIVSQRIAQQQFYQLTSGDVCMLSGTQSVFKIDEIDDTLLARLAEKDIDITAPLWGAGELKTSKTIQAFEQQIADDFPQIRDGLARFGLKQERRRIRLCVTEARFEALTEEDNCIKVTFTLPTGCFATTILRELLDYQDLTQRAQ